MSIFSTVIWFPTLRCPLKCSYCNSRSLPVITHGLERTVKQWSDIFDEMPYPIDMMTISGGEPGLYDGISEIIDHIDVNKIHFNTNLSVHPSKWVSEKMIDKMYSISASLHFDPDDPAAVSFWDGISWLVENAKKTIISATIVETQHVSPDMIERTASYCKKIGCKMGVNEYCTFWAYSDALPIMEGECFCTAGMDTFVLMPNGEMYKCLGKAYSCEKETMGNLIDEGWKILYNSPVLCNKMTCANAPDCEVVNRKNLTSIIGRMIPQGGLW